MCNFQRGLLSTGVNCPRGVIVLGDNFSGRNCPRDNIPGVIVLGG